MPIAARLAALGELLAANYLLASDLSSMPVLVKLRAKELDPPGAEAAIAAARARVVGVLKPDGGAEELQVDDQRPGLGAMQGSEAMEVLARRLEPYRVCRTQSGAAGGETGAENIYDPHADLSKHEDPHPSTSSG